MLLLAACIVLVGSRQAEISVRRFHRNKIGVRNEYRKVKNELMVICVEQLDQENMRSSISSNPPPPLF